MLYQQQNQDKDVLFGKSGNPGDECVQEVKKFERRLTRCKEQTQ
jgi:hypothetical protein